MGRNQENSSWKNATYTSNFRKCLHQFGFLCLGYKTVVVKPPTTQFLFAVIYHHHRTAKCRSKQALNGLPNFFG